MKKNQNKTERIAEEIAKAINSFSEGVYRLSLVEKEFETSVLAAPSEEEREMVMQLLLVMQKVGPITEGLLNSISAYAKEPEEPKLPGQDWSIPIAMARVMEVKKEDRN